MRVIQVLRAAADRRLVARGTSLRQLRPARFRRSRASASVEELIVRLERLVAERQQLRARSASARALERNRLRIARTQWELSHELIDQNLPAAPAATSVA
jgi:multidrug resistance efflux pump